MSDNSDITMKTSKTDEKIDKSDERSSSVTMAVESQKQTAATKSVPTATAIATAAAVATTPTTTTAAIGNDRRATEENKTIAAAHALPPRLSSPQPMLAAAAREPTSHRSVFATASTVIAQRLPIDTDTDAISGILSRVVAFFFSVDFLLCFFFFVFPSCCLIPFALLSTDSL
jgi:hypothetical protein